MERYRAGEGGIGGLSGVDAGDDGGRIGEGRNVDVVLARGEDEAREGLMGAQEGEMDQGGKAIEKKRSLPGKSKQVDARLLNHLDLRATDLKLVPQLPY